MMSFKLTWCVEMELLKTVSKILGVTIGNKFNFATRLVNTIKIADRKFNALTTVQNYMTT